MKNNTMEERRNNRKVKTSAKIFMYTFTLITILAVFGVIFGVSSLDTPNTATPEIILILSLAWFGFLTLLGNGAEATHGKNR